MAVLDISEHPCTAGRTCLFENNWKVVTSDPWVLNCIQGYVLDMIENPHQGNTPKELLKQGDWMTKVDLKDAAKHHRCHLRFRWQARTYQFNCLPFGLSTLGLYQGHQTLMTVLRTMGLRIIIYIDDIVVMAEAE